ncbi:stationary phase growth adaptation protein, partial [Escherichia coli]
MKQEVEKWRPFKHPDGDVRDLSFLDAHQVIYVQHHEDKEPLE